MTTAQQLKLEGQQMALQFCPVWQQQALDMLREFCRMAGSVPFLFEDFRAYATARGLSAPPSHKAWGALATVAAKTEIIKATGEYRATKSPATHGHPSRVWRSA